MTTASFLKGSAGYLGEDGKLYVKCDNKFAVSMLSDESKRKLIAETVGATLGKMIALSDVVPEEASAKKTYEPINELINQNTEERK